MINRIDERHFSGSQKGFRSFTKRRSHFDFDSRKLSFDSINQ